MEPSLLHRTTPGGLGSPLSTASNPPSASPHLDAINSVIFDIDEHSNTPGGALSSSAAPSSSAAVAVGSEDVNMLANNLKKEVIFEPHLDADDLLMATLQNEQHQLEMAAAAAAADDSEEYDSDEEDDDDDDEDDSDEEDSDEDDEDTDDDEMDRIDIDSKEQLNSLFSQSFGGVRSSAAASGGALLSPTGLSARYNFPKTSGAKKHKQMYVGSLQSSYMPSNRSSMGRKHARPNTSLMGATDVHHTSMGGGSKHYTSQSDSKSLFSNLQFAPFSQSASNQQQQQQMNMQQPQMMMSPLQQQQQQPAYFLSSSLPPPTTMDAFMMQQQQQQLQQHQMAQQQVQQGSFNQSPYHLQQQSFGAAASNTATSIASGASATPYQALTTTRRTKTSSTSSSKISKKESPKSSKQVGAAKKARGKVGKRQQRQDSSSVFGFGAGDESDAEADSNLDSDSDNSDSMMKEGSDEENSDTKGSRRRGQMHVGSMDSNASGSLLNSDSLFDLMMSSKGRDAYFWQYNVQSKGPKTKKVLTLRNRDPHLHRDFHDPVFQLQNLNSRGGASLNKLRKGDGNDVTPNPEKLYNLGNQIHDFIQKSYQINSACFNNPAAGSNTGLPTSMSGGANLVSSPPVAGALSTSLDASNQPPRVNLKREKNKIASRACRLKKKAQHEANKIKLFGLNDEHKQLIECINMIRDLIRKKIGEPNLVPSDRKMTDMVEELIRRNIRTKVAGNSDGYVHSLMLAVERQRAATGGTSGHKKSAGIDLNQFNIQYGAELDEQQQQQQQQQQQSSSFY